MIPNRSQSSQAQVPPSDPMVHRLELEDTLYAAFIKMRNLLEDYAPSWYTDEMRENIESVVQHIEK